MEKTGFNKKKENLEGKSLYKTSLTPHVDFNYF